MKLSRFIFILIAIMIILVGCSKSLTSPDENNLAERPTTTLSFRITEPTHVLLYVTNFNFELVKVLVDEELNCGYYAVEWNGRDYNDNPVASGVYYAFIITNYHSDMIHILLIK